MDEETPTVLTEGQIRAIIQDELSRSLNLRTLTDRTVSEKHLQILDARNIQVGKANGTMIGTEATQKLGFYGATPVVQATAIANPSGGGAAGVDSSARGAIVSIITALKNAGLTA